MDLSRLWGTTALSLFALLSFAGALIVKSHCRNSRFVHWVDAGYRISVTSAGGLPSFESGSSSPQQNAAIEEIQSFLDIMGFSGFPIKIVVDRESPERWSVTSSEVVLGSKWALDPSSLQRAIAKATILHFFDPSIKSNGVYLEVITDLITQLARGHIAMWDPLRNEALDIWSVDMLENMRSVAGVCQTPWRPSENALSCLHMAPHDLESKTQNQISIWDLRPLLDNALILAFDDAPWTQRTSSIKKWLAGLRSKKWSNEARTSFDSVEKFVEAGTKALKDLSMDQLVFSKTIEVPQVDVVVLDEKYAASPSFSNEAARMVYVGPQHTYFSKNKDSLDIVEDAFYWSTKRFVWVACKMPELGDMSKIKSADHRLLYVKRCSESEQFRLSTFARLGEPGFAIENPQSTFALFNVPSVRLSFKWGLKVNDRLDFVSSKSVRKNLFGWNSAVYDEQSKTYQIKAPLPVVESFRAPVSTLSIGKESLPYLK